MASILTNPATHVAAAVLGAAIGFAGAATVRSVAAKHAFIRANPCPAAVAHSKYSCPGYVIDHVVSLDCNGKDVPENMQWQTVQAAKAKDKVERNSAECKHPTGGK